MKNTKKGFTLVELLVVIAIVAILATVAIIGYTSFIDKANLSVDQQAVEQLNTALTAGTVTFKAEDFTIENIGKVLVDSGFNMKNGINALRSGYDIYWYKTYNTVLLADDNGEVIYPTDNAELVEKFKTEYTDGTKAYNLGALVDGSSVVMNGKIYGSFQEALTEGGEITLFDDMVITDATTFNVLEDTVINLNGHKLDMSAKTTKRPFEVNSNVNLVINAEGSEIVLGGQGLVSVNGAGSGSTVIINGGEYTGNVRNGAFVRVYGERNSNVCTEVSVVLNNVTVNCLESTDNQHDYVVSNGGSAENTKLTLTVNGGSYTGSVGFQVDYGTFKGVTINTLGLGAEVYGDVTFEDCEITTAGTLTISNARPTCLAVSNGGKLTVINSILTSAVDNGEVLIVYNSGGEIVVTGSTLNGVYTADNPEQGKTSTITIDGVVVATK